MININLIAERRARKIREFTILRISILSVICMAGLMVLLNMYALYEHSSAQANLRRINSDLRDIQPEYQALLNIERQINEREPLVETLQRVRASESVWMTVMADLGRIIPSNIVLDSIKTQPTSTSTTLRLTGRAVDEDTLAKFMLSFRQRTQWAGTAVLGGASMELRENENSLGEKSVQFDLTIPVKGMAGGDF